MKLAALAFVALTLAACSVAWGVVGKPGSTAGVTSISGGDNLLPNGQQQGIVTLNFRLDFGTLSCAGGMSDRGKVKLETGAVAVCR